jgi:hypothetical protein
VHVKKFFVALSGREKREIQTKCKERKGSKPNKNKPSKQHRKGIATGPYPLYVNRMEKKTICQIR